MDAKVKRRVRPALLAGIILLGPAGVPLAAAATPPISSAPVSSEAPAMWPPSPELLAQGAGAVIGFGAFSLFVAPEAAVAGGVAGLLGGRVMAAALAGMGAVAGTYAYDMWTGLPLEHGYLWHRGGFIAGIAAGVAIFGVLGYPAGEAGTWSGWAANRAALLGTGLIGAWTADRWYAGQ